MRIFGEEYYRKAEVVTIGGLSAHAGQDMLVNYALASSATLKNLILVHGEEKSASVLMALLQPHSEIPAPVYAQKGQTFLI